MALPARRASTRVGWFVVPVAAALLIPGCGATTARVTGEVTYDGQPVGAGYVTFTPADGRGADAGAEIKDGTYTLTGLTPGLKVVKVIVTRKANFVSPGEEATPKGKAARKAGLVDPADTSPAAAEGNNVQVEIRPGDNRQDLHLKGPAKR